MATIDLGVFNVVNEGNTGSRIRSEIALKYNTDTNSFSWKQTTYRNGSLLPNFSTVYNYVQYGGNRGYGEGEIFNTSCNGYNKLIFRASNSAPWASVETQYNSLDCGYIEPVPPPPPVPPVPPVCDLTVSATSEGITGLNKEDGSITATIATSVIGNYTISLYKEGSEQVFRNIVVSDSGPTYKFVNIPKGNYSVQANSNDYGCFSLFEEISVADFSFNERFYFLFCEKRFQKRQIRISIKKRGYTGSSTLIPNGSANLVSITYPKKGDNDKFKASLGSECQISIIDEDYSFLDELEDIYSDQEKMYRIDLIFEDDNELIWTGYILPEQSIHEFKNKPYELSFIATDGIKTLSDISFDKSVGRMTFLEGVKYCLDKTDIQIGFKSMIDIVNVEASRFVLLSGLNVNKYGSDIIVTHGVYTVNGVEIIVTDDLTISVIPLFSNPNYTGVLYLTASRELKYATSVPSGNTLLANITIRQGNLTINRVTNYIQDVLANHTFDVLRFLKDDGEYTDCYTVLEYICKQFTTQIKQSGGFWVIENIGAKGRNNLFESAYNNDLSIIYENEEIDLSIDLSCDTENKVLAGAMIENGAGHKKSIVHWKLGFPKPVIKNWNFENWYNDGGKLLPSDWQVSAPYNWFERGSKMDRIYDPTTGIIESIEIQDENRRYYFDFTYRGQELTKNYSLNRIKSSQIAVFNQEIIDISAQLIFSFNANEDLFLYRDSLVLTIPFHIKIGSYKFINSIQDKTLRHQVGYGDYINRSFRAIEPNWKLNATDNDVFAIEVSIARQEDANRVKFNPYPNYGDNSSFNFSTRPAPLQGYMDITVEMPNIYADTRGGLSLQVISLNADVGFDNFRIKKTSPITGAIIKEESIITVDNLKTFSTIPEPYEVYFGDIDNQFRTDGIKDLSGVATSIWRRKGIDEQESINNIVARELLSQYQSTFRVLEGQIMCDNPSIRSIFNLPSFELYRFTALSGSFNLVECTFDGVVAEVYAEEAPNGGPIGGGGSGQLPNPNPTLVLGFKNNIFTDGNNNLIMADDGN